MNLYKKYAAKLYFFLLLMLLLHLITFCVVGRIFLDDKIRDEKLQHDINWEAVKISALSYEKIGKYEYLTGEEILPPDQRKVIQKPKFEYSPLGKAFEKQIKTIEHQREKLNKGPRGA